MPEICHHPSDTHTGSHNGRYVKSFVRAFRCGITAAQSSCPMLRMLSATMNRVPASKWDKRHGTILHTSEELTSGREWSKTGRPQCVSGCYPPRPAAEVCGTDEGQYNTRAVWSQGAFDVQSIRASQTADPRAKQTHPFGPARRSARVNTRSGDGDSPPGSMPAGCFHLEEVVESFLGQPLLAGLPAAVLPRASPLRT